MVPRVRLESRLDVDGLVGGVAELNNKIYVVCYKSSSVRVFSADPPNNRLEDIKVEGLRDPLDLIADSLTQQLYVADRKSRCVWRIAVVDNTATQFITDVNPSSLSVTSGRLLVTSSSELQLYAADGVPLQQVQLPRYIVARHAVETSRGTYIVCHSDLAKHHGVSEVDGVGRAVRVYYDGPPGPGPLQLNDPYRVTQFAAGRHLLIADRGNNRVLSLTADLKLDRVLLTEDHDGLNICSLRNMQMSLSFNEKTQRLCVWNSWFYVTVYRLE